MAAKTAASTERPRVTGDVKLLKFALTAVANADTFTVPGATRIIAAQFHPTTAVACGTSIAGAVVTFAIAAGTPSGDLLVWVG